MRNRRFPSCAFGVPGLLADIREDQPAAISALTQIVIRNRSSENVTSVPVPSGRMRGERALAEFLRKVVTGSEKACAEVHVLLCNDMELRGCPTHSPTLRTSRIRETRYPQSLGSTGSLSSASTPKKHSWTLRSGSRSIKRCKASNPSANCVKPMIASCRVLLLGAAQGAQGSHLSLWFH
jgi:hypothetical protein